MERPLNALMVLIISGVLLGALAIQFFLHEQPCPLCLLQRLGMIGVATGALMNVKFGIRKRHYGVALFACVFGGFIALRQIALHACPGFPTFGKPFWGLSLYTWSFLIFSCSVFYMGMLLCIFDKQVESGIPKKMDLIGKLAFYLLFAAVSINVITTLIQCGFSVCEDVL
jgi:disulfide bond formation protein DsbB